MTKEKVEIILEMLLLLSPPTHSPDTLCPHPSTCLPPFWSVMLNPRIWKRRKTATAPQPPTPWDLSPVFLALKPHGGLFSKPGKTVVLRIVQCPLSSPCADASFPFSVGAEFFFPLLMFCVFSGVRSAFDEDW